MIKDLWITVTLLTIMIVIMLALLVESEKDAEAAYQNCLKYSSPSNCHALKE